MPIPKDKTSLPNDNSHPLTDMSFKNALEKKSNREFLLVYFGKEPKGVQIKKLWYRGDARYPSDIFTKGFRSQGHSLDILSIVKRIY